jgi:membrane associated rhomboid family serine protease
MLPIGVVGKSKYRPLLTYSLIAINVVIFIWELSVSKSGQAALMAMFRSYALNVCDVGVEPLSNIALDNLRSMFLHGSIAHLLGNMWFLWIFGRRVEEYFGRARYLIFYLIAGSVASAGHVFLSGALNSCLPGQTSLVVGASGAISGVMGGFLLLHPGARVRTMIGLFPPFFWEMKLPAILFLGYWLVMELLKGVGWIPSIGVAHWAHIGGLVSGFGMAFLATLFVPAPQPDPFEYLDE